MRLFPLNHQCLSPLQYLAHFQEAKFNFDNPGAKFPKLPDGSVWENPTSFDNPSYNFDNTSMTANFEMRQMAHCLLVPASCISNTVPEVPLLDMLKNSASNEPLPAPAVLGMTQEIT
jgi:hypothetical protein